MATRFNLPHLDITAFISAQPYSGSSNFGGPGDRIREEHGRRLQNELNAALAATDTLRAEKTDTRLDPSSGTYLEVELRKGTRGDALESKTEKIRPGTVKADERNDRTLALYVPNTARAAFEKVLNDYLHGELTQDAGNPPNKTKVEAIEAIRVARLETLWNDDPGALPRNAQDQIWWGLWCWKGSEATIEDVCARLGVRVAGDDRRMYFPEITVVPVLATRATIELMLFATGAIAELRRASDTPVFFTDEVRGEQHAWSDDLAQRIVWPQTDVPAVCIFDTGINRSHPLIEPALALGDLHALRQDWGVDDDLAGHGTAMAGTVLHGDLTAALSDTEARTLTHRLESVKFLPPSGFDPNDPNSYGVLTQSCIAIPEGAVPDRPRVFCIAVTNEDVSGAKPSAWSAAIDQAAAGTMIGDEENAPKRLIIVSGGNVAAETDYSRIRNPEEYPIEDPAQAWNAITVGGYTDLDTVSDPGYEDWSPLAAAGELSPHSRTSVTWPQGRSPFKPEIVMEAGNRAVNPSRTEVLTVNSLSLLSTGNDVTREPLVAFEATSAAAALASRLAARLMAAHPAFWPETIRGLIVHSAEWTEPMITAFADATGVRDNYELIRHFGYGVPDFDRANASASSHLALFAQSEIQPFRTQGGRKFNECHYYNLPVPADMLERLENEIVELKITLSYFIDPNPGLSASVDPQRYQSYGLRFDLRRKGESVEVFKRRVNAAEREDPAVSPRNQQDDGRWTLGPQSVSAGSLHCDVWTGPAIELLQRDILCVKPVNGWWRQRAAAAVCNRRTRYALIVTLKTKNAELDIYTSIKTMVDVGVPIETEI
jgi:hypothetical protein